MSFPWLYGTQPPPQVKTPHELMLQRLREGVPPELAARAYGSDYNDIKEQPEIVKAVAEGEILLFERARDGGVSGAIRAAMRNEAKTWQPKAEAPTGQTLEDLLRG